MVSSGSLQANTGYIVIVGEETKSCRRTTQPTQCFSSPPVVNGGSSDQEDPPFTFSCLISSGETIIMSLERLGNERMSTVKYCGTAIRSQRQRARRAANSGRTPGPKAPERARVFSGTGRPRFELMAGGHEHDANDLRAPHAPATGPAKAASPATSRFPEVSADDSEKRRSPPIVSCTCGSHPLRVPGGKRLHQVGRRHQVREAHACHLPQHLTRHRQVPRSIVDPRQHMQMRVNHPCRLQPLASRSTPDNPAPAHGTSPHTSPRLPYGRDLRPPCHRSSAFRL